MPDVPDKRPPGTVLFAGEISPGEAWAILTSDPNAHMVDVRTQAEWAYVGIPDLSGLGKQTLLIQWQTLPAMQINAEFPRQIVATGIAWDAPLLFICRSGHRSGDAAAAMTRLGFSCCYNVTDGFEGPLDALRHRGTTAGWKASGLPWIQG